MVVGILVWKIGGVNGVWDSGFYLCNLFIGGVYVFWVVVIGGFEFGVGFNIDLISD